MTNGLKKCKSRSPTNFVIKRIYSSTEPLLVSSTENIGGCVEDLQILVRLTDLTSGPFTRRFKTELTHFFFSLSLS